MALESPDFADFYRSAHPGLVAEFYAYTGDLGEAQEIVQEAFVRAWTHWRKVSGYDRPRAWVARVGYRLAVSRWRRARTALASLLRQGPPPPAAGPSATSVALATALRALPDAQRRAVVMHHLSGYSVAEIAAAEGVAAGTVKARLSRGRRHLHDLLADSTDGKDAHA
ncbi:RNA polymerase sigma factor [Actinocorallia populi]|uniref:RNA polymerase sigma factor n=1 Tax=Actinocorallia populi TaxID=2079200 RepID=UPI0018E55E19|nr:sigma-70 family RNA polymerase sigma factor [Actinocorallia populi]